MKHLLLLVTMLFCSVSSVLAYDSELITKQITVNVSKAGTLKDKIGSSKKYRITSLKVTGELDVECEKDTDYLCKQFENRFYAFKIKDCTDYRVDYMSYEHDVSLKGEFIRNVMGRDDINEQDKAVIIRYGLQALQGEEIV